ncbi:MAG TPA: hypothetical protein PLQ76_05950 [bacterium]|nr:hypothetical protein [bacterium]
MGNDADYRKFLIAFAAVLATLAAVVGVFNYVVDPYNLNGRFDLGLDKARISYGANHLLYKIAEFDRKPRPNIILGDSRMNYLKTEKVEAAARAPYSNLAYGGGMIKEAIDTYWFASRRTHLKNAVFGVNMTFYRENLKSEKNHVGEAESFLKFKINYYLSSLITKVSVYNIVYKLTGRYIGPVVAIPRDREKLWALQLGNYTKGFYSGYRYPHALRARLEEMARDCERRGTRLILVIPPTHVDLQRKITEYHLEREYAMYKRDLARIAPVIDFDYPNEWTRNKKLFEDPYHCNESIREKMIKEVWTGNLRVGRLLGGGK